MENFDRISFSYCLCMVIHELKSKALYFIHAFRLSKYKVELWLPGIFGSNLSNNASVISFSNLSVANLC